VRVRPDTRRAPEREVREVLSAEEQAALSAIAALTQDHAPSALRIRIQLMAALAHRQRAESRRRVLAAAAGVLAAAALAAPLLLLTGSPAPSVADVLAPAHKAAHTPVPEPSDGRVTLPDVAGSGLAFPYWGDRFGWRATAVRWDRLDGRTLTTVLYARGRSSIAYTIVSGAALRAPGTARWDIRNGTHLASLSLAGRNVVIWMRRGHTCVLSGWNVPRGDLVALGAWRAHGAIPY
jgi:hypothetical protein